MPPSRTEARKQDTKNRAEEFCLGREASRSARVPISYRISIHKLTPATGNQQKKVGCHQQFRSMVSPLMVSAGLFLLVIRSTLAWQSSHEPFRSSQDLSLPNSPQELAEIITEDHQLRFGGVGRLYRSDSLSPQSVLERLHQSTVLVVGLGGVGSWAAEALCRSGVGNLILLDLDDVCISNTNRQLHALSSSIGHMKIDVLKDRFLQINPRCSIKLMHEFISRDNVDTILDSIEQNYTLSYVLDAIDDAKDKAALLSQCSRRRVPVVTCGAAAGFRNPGAIRCQDLSAVEGDKLLSATRRELRRSYGFPPGLSRSQQKKLGKKVAKWKIAGVVSTERPPQPGTSREEVSAKSSLRFCDGSIGTACFVTGAFGFVAASIIVEEVARRTARVPHLSHRR